MKSGHIRTASLLMMVLFALAAPVALAEEAVQLPAQIITAATDQQSVGTVVAAPVLPSQWNELGLLLMGIIDERSDSVIAAKTDAVIQQHLTSAMTIYEQKLTKNETDLAALDNQTKSLASELRALLLAHDQQLSELDTKLAAAIDLVNKDLSSSQTQLSTASAQHTEQISQLQAANASLSTRFWISTAVAVVGLVLAIIK